MNARLRIVCFVFSIMLASFTATCPAQPPNTWTQKANVGGVGRQNAVGFSIGSKGYTGTGQDINGVYFKDFWEYDPVTNAWSQKANFGGTSRHSAVGFSIGSKGYVGTGQEYPSFNYTRDFWEYDPALNTWTQKADFGGHSPLHQCFVHY